MIEKKMTRLRSYLVLISFVIATSIVVLGAGKIDEPDSEEKEFKFNLTEQEYKKILGTVANSEDGKIKVQENYYFDTSVKTGLSNYLLKHNGVTFRIRIIDDKAVMKLKVDPDLNIYDSKALQALPRSSPLFERSEYVCKFVDTEFARAILSGEKNIFNTTASNCIKTKKSREHPVDALHRILAEGIYFPDGSAGIINVTQMVQVGNNQTYRIVIPRTFEGVGFNLDLDKTSYPGEHVGYELECDIKTPEEYRLVERGIREFLRNLFIEERPTFAAKSAVTFMLLSGDEESYRELLDYGAIYLQE